MLSSLSKKNRSPIACKNCRLSKVRCMMVVGESVCTRCESHGLQCQFEATKSQSSGLISQKIRKLHNTDKTEPVVPKERQELFDPNAILPGKKQVIELVEIFFVNQYQGIFPFIHKPSLFKFLQSDDFVPTSYMSEYRDKFFAGNFIANLKYPDPVLLLSILALCARLHPEISVAYGDFSEDNSPEKFVPNFEKPVPAEASDIHLSAASNASKYFGWHARKHMKEVFDSPTVQRIQAFTLLSSHEWGEGNNSRSFLYVGIAARMALVLGLGNEASINNNEEQVEDENMKSVAVECKRRTIWSTYLMDRCNSSGRERSPALRIEDIKVQLPCHENDFLFGNPEPTLTYRELQCLMNKQVDRNKVQHEIKKIPILAFTIVLFEVWAKIAKWVGEVGVKHEKLSPWMQGCEFCLLSEMLDNVANVLPRKYQFSSFNLNLHTELGTATHFGYFHGLFFLCRIFLNREYLFCNPNSFPTDWWKNNTLQLLDSLQNISTLIEHLKANNMMVIAPFTGFEVYTTVITALYFCSFPNEILLENLSSTELSFDNTNEGLENWKFKYKKLALKNMDELVSWTYAWELGRKWHELSLNLGIVFGQLAQSSSDDINLDDLRHSMQDYGNGKVTEVYMPQNDTKKYSKSEAVVLELSKRASPTKNPSDVRSNIEDPSIYGNELAGIEFLSLPSFSLFTNSPSIYPGWNGISNIEEFLNQ